MDITSPKAKKRCKLSIPRPLPLIPTENDKLYVFKGLFDGFTVRVTDPNDMKKIVSMGYFGKANLSRSYPQFDGNLEKPEIIRKRQYQRRSEWHKKFDMKAMNKVIVVPDSEDEGNYFTNLQAVFEIDRCGNKESVNLMLEEAYFLHYALGCLEISYENQNLDYISAWDVFNESDPCFRLKYIVYYYYRSKNWVVKPGIKFGGDFLLYKIGPPFYHASYVVLIQNIQENESKTLDTIGLMGLHRMCETAGKELIIFQVLNFDCSLEPNDISKVEIKEILMKRWVSSQERRD